MARKRSSEAGLYLLPVYLPFGNCCMDCPAIRKEINSRECFICRSTGEVLDPDALDSRGESCPLLPVIYTEDKQ